jgi:hypothetical protein
MAADRLLVRRPRYTESRCVLPARVGNNCLRMRSLARVQSRVTCRPHPCCAVVPDVVLHAKSLSQDRQEAERAGERSRPLALERLGTPKCLRGSRGGGHGADFHACTQAKKDKYKAFSAGSGAGAGASKAFGKEPKAKTPKPAIKGRISKKPSKAGTKPSKGSKKKFKKGK